MQNGQSNHRFICATFCFRNMDEELGVTLLAAAKITDTSAKS
jgi:hypothetical protein